VKEVCKKYNVDKDLYKTEFGRLVDIISLANSSEIIKRELKKLGYEILEKKKKEFKRFWDSKNPKTLESPAFVIANCKNNGTFLTQFAILAKLTKVHRLMSFAIRFA